MAFFTAFNILRSIGCRFEANYNISWASSKGLLSVKMIKTTMSQKLCRQCCCNSHDLGATTSTILVIPILPILELTLLKEIPILMFVFVSPRSLGLFVDFEVFWFTKLLSRLPSTKKTKETSKGVGRFAFKFVIAFLVYFAIYCLQHWNYVGVGVMRVVIVWMWVRMGTTKYA